MCDSAYSYNDSLHADSFAFTKFHPCDLDLIIVISASSWNLPREIYNILDTRRISLQ